MTPKYVLVVGAAGAVGLEIVRILREKGLAVRAAYRTPREASIKALEALGAETLRWVVNDRPPPAGTFSDIDAVVMTPMLTAAARVLPHLPCGFRDDPKHRRILFFSSNNIAIDPDAEMYVAIAAAEREIVQQLPDAAILRPTMIYGHPRDGNTARLMRLMRRYPVAPVAGGSALRQPIFFGDLARIATDLVCAESWRSGVFIAAGPTIVRERDLFSAARAACGARSVIVPAPTAAMRLAAWAARRAGARFPLKPEQIDRAGRDRLPEGENLVLGNTTLDDGLLRLAAALDEDEPRA